MCVRARPPVPPRTCCLRISTEWQMLMYVVGLLNEDTMEESWLKTIEFMYKLNSYVLQVHTCACPLT